jgi:hypothetical protein
MRSNFLWGTAASFWARGKFLVDAGFGQGGSAILFRHRNFAASGSKRTKISGAIPN